MGGSLADLIAGLPEQRRGRAEARSHDLEDEVEGRCGLRKPAGKARADLTTAPGIKPPSVSNIEKRADMRLSTTRSDVRAVGGNLDPVVRHLSRAPMPLRSLGDVGIDHAMRRGRRRRSGSRGRGAGLLDLARSDRS